MPDAISFCFDVHAAPSRAESRDGLGGPLTLRFAPGDSIYPSINIFTGSPALACDLAEAINAVLAKHRAPQIDEAA